MNVAKHIDYWRSGASEDFDVAKVLMEKGRFRHALFFAHLAVEKLLKAHVTRFTNSLPPKTHNLVLLLERAGLELLSAEVDVYRELNVYQLEGRYPGELAPEIDETIAKRDIACAEEVFEWLNSKL